MTDVRMSTKRNKFLASAVVLASAAWFLTAQAGSPAIVAGAFKFAVAGDSRDCGDLVMPAIAAGVSAEQAAFYWHLGNLRKGSSFDADFLWPEMYQEPGMLITPVDYSHLAIADLIEHQLKPFGDTPLFLGIGKQDVSAPFSRLQHQVQFRDYLGRPEIKLQRNADGIPEKALKPRSLNPTYYHWRRGTIDFISLDNAFNNAFDKPQLEWFDEILRRAVADRAVKGIVVGMHESLPHAVSDERNMCMSKDGVESGEHVYRALAAAQAAGKHVYVVASHAHYYLSGIYDSEYWRDPAHGGVVLPGWMVGTAGGERDRLPPGVTARADAREGTYGFLVGEAHPDGTVDFRFRALEEKELVDHMSPEFNVGLVQVCARGNPRSYQTTKRKSPNFCETATDPTAQPVTPPPPQAHPPAQPTAETRQSS